jgi:hypothetical protein
LQIHTGEIYGKQTALKIVMYTVLKISKNKGSINEVITLQNIDNPLRQFETTTQKILSAGYFLISRTPYVNLKVSNPKRGKSTKKLTRCPLTIDFLEDRADSQRPTLIHQDLFD